MAELIRNEVIIANTADRWEAIRKAPKINEAIVGENNTSQSLNIVWYGSSAEYQALPLKHPDTFYIITDSELPSDTQNYLLFANKPKINGIELADNITLEDLSLYNRDEVDALLRQIGRMLVVSQETWEQIVDDHTLGFANTIYYVEKETEGAYDTYMMDANKEITYIGSNEAYFTEYQKCHPTNRVDGIAKDAIEIADGTVIGAIETLGDEKELETTSKASAVAALNEVNAKKLGQEHLSHTLTHFGVWKGGATNRNYKLATITFSSQYEYFSATLKLMPNYKNFHLTGAEIDFNLRAGAKSLDALQLYELKAYDVPDEFPTGKVYLYIYYDKPTIYPQTAEIWLLTKGGDYQEFMGDWQVKETMPSYPLAKFDVIEKPVDDQSFSHLTGGSFSIDLGQQKNNTMVLQGEMNTTLTNATRNSIKTAAGTRTDFVQSLVSFTKAESPDDNAASVFNVHVMTVGGKTSLFATNIETNYEYRSTWNGSAWGEWQYIYGVDGGIGGLQEITTAPDVNVGSRNNGKGTTVKNLQFTYNCIDMGEYYINEIRMKFLDNNETFNSDFLDSKYYRTIDGRLMKFTAIKGKPIIDNGYYATSFIQMEQPKLAHQPYDDEIRDGVTYIKSDKTIWWGVRFLHSSDYTKQTCIFCPGNIYNEEPRYPFYVEYNFLTRK